jgi:hypothetical protein
MDLVLAVGSGSPLLRWFAPRPRTVLYVDGEMPLVSLQERLRIISAGLGVGIPNDGFRILAADQTDDGISLGSEVGQKAIEPLLHDVDLLILDNLSTLCTASESANDAWVPMQNWLLGFVERGSRLCSSTMPATTVSVPMSRCLWGSPLGRTLAGLGTSWVQNLHQQRSRRTRGPQLRRTLVVMISS